MGIAIRDRHNGNNESRLLDRVGQYIGVFCSLSSNMLRYQGSRHTSKGNAKPNQVTKYLWSLDKSWPEAEADGASKECCVADCITRINTGIHKI